MIEKDKRKHIEKKTRTDLGQGLHQVLRSQEAPIPAAEILPHSALSKENYPGVNLPVSKLCGKSRLCL